MVARTALAVKACVMVAAGSIYAASLPSAPPELGSLKSPDPEVRVRAASALVQYRIDLVQGIMSILRRHAGTDDDTPRDMFGDEQVVAIELLGVLRASEAGPLLVQNIRVRVRNFMMEEAVARTIVYPAAESLVSIGAPAVASIVARLGGEISDEERQLLTDALSRIEGRETAAYILEAPQSRTPPCPRAVQTAGATASILTDLGGSDRHKRMLAAGDIRESRWQLIKGLLTILTESEPQAADASSLRPDSTVMLAIKVLGEIRAAEAVPLLMRRLYVMAGPGPSPWPGPAAVVHAAADALVRIGTPAVEPIVQRLQGDWPRETREALVGAVYAIEGTEVARFILDAPRKRIKDPFVQKHLGESLEILDKLSKGQLIRRAPATGPS
jgi:HEAT repeat protein